MTERPVVALGDRSYRVERDWAKVPDGVTQGFVSQVAVDSVGQVYLLQRGGPPVLVFAPDGRYLHSLAEGLVLDGHAIAIDAADRIFLTDRDAHQILVLATDGRELARLGERHRPRFGLPFNHPTDVAVAADGEIYVSDGYGNAAVHRFSADLRHLQTWGTPGDGPGAFSTPHAIWVDSRDRVLVADRENDRLQVFDRDGRHLADWPGFYHPMDIWEDARGMVFVSDQIPRLTMLDGEGRLAGRCRGALNGAHGIWGDGAGNLFMAELPPARLTRLALLT